MNSLNLILTNMNSTSLYNLLVKLQALNKLDVQINTWLTFERHFKITLKDISKYKLWGLIQDQQNPINFLYTLAYAHYAERQRCEKTKKDKVILTSPIQDDEEKTTLQKTLNMVDSAKQEIIILGYSFSDFMGLSKKLKAKIEHGVSITAIGQDEFIQKLRAKVKSGWGAGEIKFYRFNNEHAKDYLKDKFGDNKAGFPKFHAKVIIVDKKEGLVTSANLTYSGMNSNIEIGTTIGVKLSKQILEFINKLIESDLVVKYTNWY